MSEDRTEEARRMLVTADAVRAGLFATSQDIIEQLKLVGAENIAASAMAGSAYFVAELYEQLAEKSGADKSKFKEHMLSSIGKAFDDYCARTVREKVGG